MRWMLLVLVVACEGGGRSSRGDVASADVALAPRVLVCADGECTDPATGLDWAQGERIEDAAASCAAIVTANRANYRVPTRAEAEAFPFGDDPGAVHPAFKGSMAISFYTDDGTLMGVNAYGLVTYNEGWPNPVCVSDAP